MKRSFRYHINRWLKRHIDLVFQPARAWSKPNRLWLETDRLCNLNCRMCARRMEDRFHAGENLQEEVFRLAKPYFEMCDVVQLFGWNEPLMDKDIIEKIRSAAVAGAKVHFNTNATLLTEEIAEKLIDIPVTDLGVSIDGATKETYEYLRVGANFEQVKENVKRLTALKAKRGVRFPEMHLVFCALNRNLDEVAMMPALARELDVLRVDLTDSIFFTREMAEEFGYAQADFLAAVEEARKAAEKLGVEILHVPYDSDSYLELVADEPASPDDDVIGRRMCSEVYTTMIILANGNVVPCCFQFGRPVGNIKNQSIAAIWNGEGFRNLRRLIREGRPPPVCRTCPCLKHPGKQAVPKELS